MTPLPRHTPQLAQTLLAGYNDCKVMYHADSDTVEVSIGATSLRFEANRFIVVHEMLRKAAAKIVMQTNVQNSLASF